MQKPQFDKRIDANAPVDVAPESTEPPTQEEPPTHEEPPHFESFKRRESTNKKDNLLFEIEYADVDGVVTVRVISPVYVEEKRRFNAAYIMAFCHKRKETRTFRNDRILSCKNLLTGEDISDLQHYLELNPIYE